MNRAIQQEKKRQAKRLNRARRGREANKAARLARAAGRNTMGRRLEWLLSKGIDPSDCSISGIYEDGDRLATRIHLKPGARTPFNVAADLAAQAPLRDAAIRTMGLDPKDCDLEPIYRGSRLIATRIVKDGALAFTFWNADKLL